LNEEKTKKKKIKTNERKKERTNETSQQDDISLSSIKIKHPIIKKIYSKKEKKIYS
jgi:hypothetical protein